MAETKKYYWLRLQRNFFKRHDIQIIEAMENGKDYVLFYLKLLVESVDHEGALRFSDTIPYNDKMLATITNTNVDIVRSALQAFEELGMIEVLDDKTIYINEVEKLIGSEVSNEAKKENARERVRRFRERQKALEQASETTGCNATSRYSNVTRNVELEKELELEKECSSTPEPTLHNSNISQKCFEELCRKYGTAFVSERAERAYNDALLAKFCEEDFAKIKPKTKKNGFNNINQRDYDYDELEQKLRS